MICVQACNSPKRRRIHVHDRFQVAARHRLVLAAVVVGCAPGEAPLDAAAWDAGPDFADAAACSPAPIGTPGDYAVEELEGFVAVTRGGATYQVYVRQARPRAADYPGQCFPAVLMIAGGWGAGAKAIGTPPMIDMASAGVVVVGFNPESRGTGDPGDLRSDGPVPEDYNGFAHQDDCGAVLASVVAEPLVDDARVGVWSHSNGITIAAGCLNRHPELPVKFLMDEEGPHCPRDLLADPDATIAAALRTRWAEVVAEKVGPGLDYETEEAFWAERCAVEQIGGIRAMYRRFQAEEDHALGFYYRHTVAMVAQAVGGGVPWVRLNDRPSGVVYDETSVTATGVLLSGKLADPVHEADLRRAFLELMAF
jgi:hypothetical protein